MHGKERNRADMMDVFKVMRGLSNIPLDPFFKIDNTVMEFNQPKFIEFA